MLIGIGTLAAGIFVCAEAGNFLWYDGTFAALGLGFIVMSIIGHKTRTSRSSLLVYLVVVLVLFILQVAFTIGILAYQGF